ncbi:MerR family transcriptional regulator [Nocardioides bizhenqiangii]|uniref:MerR family transcriptional regulator n=1 Tax=Nocardioides bizhenqiangii TaxID=3095076 RepID=A0ABZ0ZQ88_9ACTN|nr:MULTISPECIES: MerR family transcriptional regulator [unclassified Nocardioides]MDZ5619498.1 MerR family transcriptional regulator [Nocardioides sp. HM23]WQQ26485.1 MerR family transcriptional regulator [Nocardioides sp. HM61]
MKSSRNEIRWSVGELAHRFELPTHVLRHWETMGLLAPERDAAGRRRYREDDAYRVAAIVSSKAAGMSLDQIRSLLDAGADDRRQILTDHLADLAARMAEMERSRHLTEHALECRAHDVANCPNFRAHVADLVAGTRRGLHPGRHPGPGQHLPARA